MIDYSAFHGEIEKIAADNDKGRITKEKLKRFAIAAPVAAGGAALGHGVGQLVRRNVLSPRTLQALDAAAKRKPLVAKAVGALPAVAGGLAAGAGMMQAMKARQMRDFIEGKKEDGGRTDTQ
jgi:hypothetical protein